MKLYLDGQPLLGNKTGIGYYTNNLLNEFKGNKSLKINLITNQTINHKRLSLLKKQVKGRDHIKLVNMIYPYKVFRRVTFSEILYKLPIDFLEKTSFKKQSVFHATNFITLPTKYAKQVITVHDLAFMKFPEVVEKNIYDYMMKWVPYSVNLADEIIADSVNTKNDIIELLNVPEEKISVVYLAADNRFKKQVKSNMVAVRNYYDLPENYFLYLGTLEPKKNLPLLIKALSILKHKYNSNYKLVVVGAKGWKFNPIFDLVTKLNLENDIIFTGYIADEDLPAIYSGATAFTFPSLYEGFGIPPLEAMQCEVPVIASNASCIPEVVGDGGILLDPTDAESWAEAMYNLSVDEQLHNLYVQKGLVQATKFSWEKTAQETLEVYKKALKR